MNNITDVWKMLETDEGRAVIANKLHLSIRQIPYTQDLIDSIQGDEDYCVFCGQELEKNDNHICGTCIGEIGRGMKPPGFLRHARFGGAI